MPGIATAPDLVRRDFAPAAPNRLWVADLTEISTWEGKLYLAVVIDCYSRRCVGWAMADHMRAELVVEALEMGIWQRRPDAGLVHHSDRGGQYVSLVFGQTARSAGIDISMGAKGCALDNAVAEAFFATLKKELTRPALLAHVSRTAERRVHMDRGLVQPSPAALHPRLPLTRRLRKQTHAHPRRPRPTATCRIERTCPPNRVRSMPRRPRRGARALLGAETSHSGGHQWG